MTTSLSLVTATIVVLGESSAVLATKKVSIVGGRPLLIGSELAPGPAAVRPSVDGASEKQGERSRSVVRLLLGRAGWPKRGGRGQRLTFVV